MEVKLWNWLEQNNWTFGLGWFITFLLSNNVKMMIFKILFFLRKSAPELSGQFSRGAFMFVSLDSLTWSYIHLPTRTPAPLWSRRPGGCCTSPTITPASSRPAQLIVSLPGWSVPPPSLEDCQGGGLVRGGRILLCALHRATLAVRPQSA